ncbi:tetratricopeptide repeat protein [Prochlorococcus marinus]|uniref:SAM-dependent methyltransferase n=1 Tax=Prochlorococcus marinus XMU1408 TaxID=2213228 RepID=A0A318R1N2_PROMR|nr:tetratricopeptide repeat protein [Prochlorococcus marinus]MBW3041059.1 SAM-dependent methyltransferase [Prochlorococcus marinus str. XMU1408]PYE03666.1 SAM-dependent methyltransferase [Prochlorococcus marinus XMU1408]
MDSSSQEGEVKKKINEIKTFPVPLTIGEIKENIIINTNKPNQLSKEEIINQAYKFHSIGNISKASKYYQYFINQGFKDHRVFSNYGSLLESLGKLQEAKLYTSKAIELNPNFAKAHYNLGTILTDLGKLQEAALSFRKAIKLNPGFAKAHSNLGNILNDLGKLQEAALSFRKAIKLNPDFAKAHSNLGKILNDLGDQEGAFDSYLKAIDINPKNSNIYSSITRFLQESDPAHLNKSKLKKILNILLEKNNVSHQELLRPFNFLYSNQIINNIKKTDQDFSKLELLIKDKIIINALKKIIFCDLKLESILTEVRKNICYRIAKNTENINYSELQFIIALGEQCFFNEYIYSITEKEKICINIIIKKCRDGELNERTIAILSCYFPLYKLIEHIESLKSFNSADINFQQLLRFQISEPLKEIQISKNIKKLGSINDSISQKVKTQYEKNPYPRWRFGNPSTKKKVSIIQAINNEIKPNSISYNIRDSKLKVLIAGCGTGQQILNTQIYKNAHFSCIDLSLSSLSYAQRKINELGIKNVKLIEMDILEVGLLEEQFDIIECGGVLHHMENPSKGLKALLGVLKKTGFLKLGLYSELARQNIIQARNYIASKKIQANEDSIRDFRERIISGKLKNLNSLTTCKDFYSLSEFRDLCFHSKEHRFTINQLHETLKSNKLKFLGFLLPKPVKSSYKQYFPEDKKQINLQNWTKFEEKNPNTFKAMYQFWTCKTEI